mmetsp:Transcript_957/g.2078  ORF Transcript_957/g.2078 Transcript_957/m.2078 type:complete len:221 (-) Transcript_957:72-734(-)
MDPRGVTFLPHGLEHISEVDPFALLQLPVTAVSRILKGDSCTELLAEQLLLKIVDCLLLASGSNLECNPTEWTACPLVLIPQHAESMELVATVVLPWRVSGDDALPTDETGKRRDAAVAAIHRLFIHQPLLVFNNKEETVQQHSDEEVEQQEVGGQQGRVNQYVSRRWLADRERFEQIGDACRKQKLHSSQKRRLHRLETAPPGVQIVVPDGRVDGDCCV